MKATDPTPFPRYGLSTSAFPLKIHHWTRSRFEIHGHQYLELMVVTKTAGRQRLNGVSKPMKEGEVYFLGPWVDHEGSTTDGGALGHYAIDFLPETLGIAATAHDFDDLLHPFFMPNGKPLVLPVPSRPRIVELCETLLAECGNPRPYGDAIAGRTLAILLYELKRLTPTRPKAGDTALVSALRYIHAHFKDGFTPAGLAEAAGLSYSRITQLFRASLKKSPREILVERRMMEARRLLVESGGTLADILSRCGFSDPSYFHRAFHKATGLTPGEFRTVKRGGEEVHGGMAPRRG